MQKRKLNNQGFGIIAVLVIVLVLAVVGGAGYVVWQKNHDSKKSTTQTSKTDGAGNKSDSNGSKTTVDPYAGWKAYSNSTYGISFKYPSTWTLTEGSASSSDSATKQEYAINLKRSEQVKYNDTASVEVLGEDVGSAATWYDNYFAQSSLNNVSKVNTTLKGKTAVTYDVTNSGTESKVYLFGVADKTYLVTSVNEDTNVAADASYWSNLDKMIASLEIK